MRWNNLTIDILTPVICSAGSSHLSKYFRLQGYFAGKVITGELLVLHVRNEHPSDIG